MIHKPFKRNYYIRQKQKSQHFFKTLENNLENILEWYPVIRSKAKILVRHLQISR